MQFQLISTLIVGLIKETSNLLQLVNVFMLYMAIIIEQPAGKNSCSLLFMFTVVLEVSSRIKEHRLQENEGLLTKMFKWLQNFPTKIIWSLKGEDCLQFAYQVLE